MDMLPFLAAALAAVSVVTAYWLGYRNGFSEGRDQGYGDGKRDGKKEGCARGFAVGYDRGKRAKETEDEPPTPPEEPPASRGVQWGLVAFAAGVLLVFGLIARSRPPDGLWRKAATPSAEAMRPVLDVAPNSASPEPSQAPGDSRSQSPWRAPLD